MQIRKFEAKSMKEALQLVKQNLGPDAVILSAKDNRKAFGLSGDRSVEVTAAVADETYRRMRVAHQKMRDEDRLKFNQAPAKQQKEYIEKVFEVNKAPERREMTSVPYIDILEDEQFKRQSPIPKATAPRPQQQQQNTVANPPQTQRVKDAAKLAWDAVKSNRELIEEKAAFTQKPQNPESRDREIFDLQSEILRLRNLVENFQKVPQNFLSLHPGASEGIPFELSFMFEKLTRSGISVENTVEILELCRTHLNPEKMKNRSYVDAWVAKYLMDHVRIADRSKTQKFQVLVGTPGQGKTSTLIKMASRLLVTEKKKIAIITTDHLKIGASEQMRIYAQILNVPFAVVKRKEDWSVLTPRLAGVDTVLVDMPGLSLQNLQEIETLRSQLPEAPRSIHYVQSVLAKDKDASEILRRYRTFGVEDIIFTQLDQSVQHGIVFNLQKEMQLPLLSFGIGPQIPEDFEFATKERVVDLIFKLSKLRTGETDK